MQTELPSRDPLAELITATREVIARYYPDADYATLVIVSKDKPDVVIPVSSLVSSCPSA